MNQDLVICQAMPELETCISEFFQVLSDLKECHFFQPHPFTPEQAYFVANYVGRDFYALVLHKGKAIGYGMLRGWDDGYEIPSLGISIHPDFRGVGIGLVLMHYLHAVVTLRGCTKVRLRVKRDNKRARHIYEKLGYQFEEHNEDYIIGFLELRQR